MKKILIVEDEISAREGIFSVLSKEFPECSIMTASDGMDGYKQALRTQPSIIISDIRMPHMDGLTMLEKLRDQKITSQVIFLTGFAEFKYAQKAIQLDTSDYLLKPINARELVSKVHGLIDKINHSAMQDEQLINDLRKLYLVTEDDSAVIDQVLKKHEYTDCFVGVIYMGQSEHLPENIKEMFHSNQNVFTIVLPNRHYRGIFLGFKNHDIQYITISRISSLLAEHEALICTYTISRMRAVTDWGEIFTALTKAVPWSITYKTQFLAYSPAMAADLSSAKSVSSQLTDFRKKIQAKYLNDTHENCKKEIYRFIEMLRSSEASPSEIITAASYSLNKSIAEADYLSFSKRIHECITYQELMTVLEDYFYFIDSQKENTQYSKQIQKAILYITNNYNELISLTSAAEYLGITPQYLSKLFTQETKETFVDFLSSYRMEKAKSLLTETSLQINEIGKRVGYADPKYFCTLFKKKTGMTPNQFRKR